MRDALPVALLCTMTAFASTPLAGQCASSVFAPNYGSSLSFDSGSGILPGQVSNAIGLWSGGGSQAGSGFPTMLADAASATYSFSVELTPGANPGTSQTGVGCGYFQPTTNSFNAVIGGTIVLYDARTDGGDCEPLRVETIAHEMGHALGLADSNGLYYMIGPPVTGASRSVHSDECQEADSLWMTPAETPGGGGGCVVFDIAASTMV